MKLLTIFLACLVSCDEKKVPPKHPLQRLRRLAEFSQEILQSGAFANAGKSDKWITKWSGKFLINQDRMEISFSRCGFYDAT